jgi:hypothetical protein
MSVPTDSGNSAASDAGLELRTGDPAARRDPCPGCVQSLGAGDAKAAVLKVPDRHRAAATALMDFAGCFVRDCRPASTTGQRIDHGVCVACVCMAAAVGKRIHISATYNLALLH